MTAITDQTAERLSYCEQTIALGKQTFLEVGNALAEIMEGQLYKSKGYGSFAEYCDKEWGFKKTYAYQLVNSAKAADSVSAIAENLNEAQARALAKVPESKRVEVIEQAAKSGKVTAKSIAAAAETTEPAPPRSSETDFVKACGNPPMPELHIEVSTVHYYAMLEELVTDALTNGTLKQLRSLSVGMAAFTIKIKQQIKALENA